MPGYVLPAIAATLVLLQLWIVFRNHILKFYISLAVVGAGWAAGYIFNHSLLIAFLASGLLALVLSFFIKDSRPLFFLELVTASGIAIALLKFGCFLQGCCFGAPTDLPIGVSFAPGTPAFIKYGSAPLHPVQLYEMGMGLAIYFIGGSDRVRRRLPDSYLALSLVLSYLAFKLLVF